MDKSVNVKVAVRCRPMSSKEIQRNEPYIVQASFLRRRALLTDTTQSLGALQRLGCGAALSGERVEGDSDGERNGC